MIRFFRNIRYNLLNESKVGKYFKYAIGEVILVVVGILIALQINNWNENRKSRAKEKLLLKELHLEFKENKMQLDTVVYYHRRALKSAENILDRFPIKNSPKQALDSIGQDLYFMIYHYTFNPSKGITNSLLHSSSYDIISNDSLRNLLIRWNDQVEDYREEEITANDNFIHNLKPYIKQQLNLNLDYTKWLNDPRVDLNLLGSLEFENFIRDRHIDLSNIVSVNGDNPSPELLKIYDSIDMILNLSQSKGDD